MRILLAFLLLFTACNFTNKGVDNSVPVVVEEPGEPSVPSVPSEPVVEPQPEPIEQPAPEPVPVEETKCTIKTNIQYFGSAATAARKAKYDRAIEVFKKVVCDPEFKARVIGHKYNGQYGYAYMDSDPVRRTTLVYEHILAGNEKLQPEKDNEVDMEVEFYYANNTTVGYTYPNVKRIYVNTKYFDTYTLSSVAANLIHEWLHKLGYDHDSKATARRPYSVPYGVGSIMRTLGAKYE